jgi:hypothetical protein
MSLFQFWKKWGFSAESTYDSSMLRPDAGKLGEAAIKPGQGASLLS